MAQENELKPLDISAAKSSTSRIDLSKATIPASPGTSGIRIGANPKKATSRIDINAIPGAAKAQTGRVGIGAMPPADDDIYKRRTTLLDTSKIPLASAPHAAPASASGGGQPRTLRLGGRPPARVGGSAPATFSPGRAGDEETGGEAAPSGRPTIKLKRPGGAAVSVSAAGGTATFGPEPVFTIQEEEGPGALWAVLSLLSMFVAIGLVVVQVLTIQGSTY